MHRNTDYQNHTDEMLIEELRGGQPELMDYIMEKYKYLVRKRANAMFLICLLYTSPSPRDCS